MAAFGESVVHHCELICQDAQGANRNWYNCRTNPGHKEFLPVDDFRMEHLPPECRTDEVMNEIKDLINRTVNINVSYTSEKRPDTFPDSPTPYPFCKNKGSSKHPRCGTGTIRVDFPEKIRNRCPCPECEGSNQPEMEYWKVRVFTAAHVVYDSFEAESSKIEVFYDRESKEGVKILYGMGVWHDDMDMVYTDICDMCCVTHDAELAERLDNICQYHSEKQLPLQNQYFMKKIGVIVSHPHGVSKRISIGNILGARIVVDELDPFYSIALKKGTRVSIPLSIDKQEDTNRDDQEGGKDTPPHKKIKSSLSQSTGEDNPDTKESVKPKGNEKVKVKSQCNFNDFLDPTTDKDVFVLKVPLKAFPPSKSSISCDGLTTPGVFTFPPNTKYVAPDKTRVVVPKEIKIHHKDVHDWKDVLRKPCVLTYDISTCPGSSGAFISNNGDTAYGWCHFGNSNGINQSGCWNSWYPETDIK